MCEKLCYADKGHFKLTSTIRRYQLNDQLRLDNGFVRLVSRQLRTFGIRQVRVHVSGDFDTEAYIRKWVNIVSAHPMTQFLAYTRSWRVNNEDELDLLSPLMELANLPNMHLWWSCDRETGEPPAVKNVRRAYLITEKDEKLPYAVDLVFKTHKARQPIATVLHDGAVVCPAERKSGKSKTTCDVCRLCLERSSWLDKKNQQSVVC